jgi:SOS-response transcriptional repressor LexA
MIYIRRVVGQSMLPTLRPGQFCVFRKARCYKSGDVVFAYADGRPVVKRAYRQDMIWRLEGDNYQASNSYRITHQTSANRLVAKLWFPRIEAKEVI